MVNIVGKYQHERSENLDEYFRGIGVPYIPRKMMAMSNPRIEITQEGDKWTIKNITMIRTQVMTFTLGEEFEEHMPFGVTLKNTATLEGDVLIIICLGPDGQKVTRKYEFTDEQMILTMSEEKMETVCKRYFKRLE